MGPAVADGYIFQLRLLVVEGQIAQVGFAVEVFLWRAMVGLGLLLRQVNGVIGDLWGNKGLTCRAEMNRSSSSFWSDRMSTFSNKGGGSTGSAIIRSYQMIRIMKWTNV